MKINKSRQNPLYNKWRYMVEVCNNENNPQHYLVKQYGWTVDFKNFKDFELQILSTIGPPPPDAMLCRRDCTRGWNINNLTWGDQKVRANRQRTCDFIRFRGRTQTLTQWAEELAIDAHTLLSRLYKLQWSVKRALTTPVRPWERHSG
jgi:hypothetical protein